MNNNLPILMMWIYNKHTGWEQFEASEQSKGNTWNALEKGKEVLKIDAKSRKTFIATSTDCSPVLFMEFLSLFLLEQNQRKAIHDL